MPEQLEDHGIILQHLAEDKLVALRQSLASIFAGIYEGEEQVDMTGLDALSVVGAAKPLVLVGKKPVLELLNVASGSDQNRILLDSAGGLPDGVRYVSIFIDPENDLDVIFGVARFSYFTKENLTGQLKSPGDSTQSEITVVLQDNQMAPDTVTSVKPDRVEICVGLVGLYGNIASFDFPVDNYVVIRQEYDRS